MISKNMARTHARACTYTHARARAHARIHKSRAHIEGTTSTILRLAPRMLATWRTRTGRRSWQHSPALALALALALAHNT